MTFLSPIQPFGDQINPFSTAFRDRLNALAESVIQASRNQRAAEVDAEIDRLKARPQPWCWGRITARTAAINANYDADPTWGTPLFARNATPVFRQFLVEQVNISAAEVGDPCMIFLNHKNEINLLALTEFTIVENCTAEAEAAAPVPSVARENHISVYDEFNFSTTAAAKAPGIFQFNRAT